jgi:uncharacterized protein
MDRRLAEFIRLFNTRKFFEAHEVLEELWLETHGEEKDFYKGLIQCAAAFVHLQRSNPGGARKLFARARSHLLNFPPTHGSIHLSRLLNDVSVFFAMVLDRERHDAGIQFDQMETPQIHEAG